MIWASGTPSNIGERDRKQWDAVVTVNGIEQKGQWDGVKRAKDGEYLKSTPKVIILQ